MESLKSGERMNMKIIKPDSDYNTTKSVQERVLGRVLKLAKATAALPPAPSAS
jgi:hypothetical protein